MTTETTLAIDDLSARRAEVLKVADALASLRGVTQVHVDSGMQSAHVEYDPGLIVPVQLLDAVEAAGFQARELARR